VQLATGKLERNWDCRKKLVRK